MWPGAPIRAHWGVEDPAAAPEEDQPAAFRTAYDILKRRADALLAEQNLAAAAADTRAFQTTLNQIGTLL